MVKITIFGSHALYTVEQLFQMLLPDLEGTCDCRVTIKDGSIYALCHIDSHGRSTSGTGHCRLSGDAYRDVNLERRTLARAVYRAALGQMEQRPAWGMLSGVRPGKLVRAHLEKGGTLPGAVSFLENAYFVSPEKAQLCARVGKIAYDLGKSIKNGAYSLYAHIPFCPSRCTYCSFISTSGEAFSQWGAAYFEALCRELAMLGRVRETLHLRTDNIYIGGGTPAVYTPDRLSRLCEAVSLSCGTLPGEFTVEAGRPDAITAEKLKALLQGGVTRICVNPQTMHDRTLERIGRKHTALDTRRAFSLARDAGFSEINCDLIAGLPGESASDFSYSLGEVIALDPENITVHTLARKRGSAFHEQQTESTPAGDILEMLRISHDMLTQAGYEPYYLYRQKYTGGGFENIGWAKPGHICRYNVAMMEEIGDIFSAGAGAVTKLTSHAFTRFTNPKYPAEYLAAEDPLTREKELLQYFGA